MKLIVCLLFLSLTALAHAAEEKISLTQTSKSGLRGWTEATAKNYQDAWMNSRLIVLKKNGKRIEFTAERVFIHVWGFVDNDTAVVIRSQNAHGPYYWQKFDITSGKLIQDYYRYRDPDHIPSWVLPFLGES